MAHVPPQALSLAARLVEPTWRASAACHGVDAEHFFPPSHFERKPEKDLREGAARALCARCPVRQECLDYALLVEEPHGIWGGMNELERRRLLRQRSASPRVQTASAPGPRLSVARAD
ncbi:MAG: WhiB family transcriptional regulator [Actinomycetota bacterium]|jgi:WhiB family redox-sensing transcriptional regulator|nr:WhiB family transcriptional regulator [Actinomycetota bacterium]